MGLRRLGIRFRHATMPRGKLIERVFGSLTDLTMMLPGYAGRNQMTDRYEDTHHRALRAKPRPDASVREHPKDLGFLHRSQLVEYIEEIARKLNSTVMRGEYHQKCVGGKTIFLSPNEAYEEFFAVPLEPLVSADATPEALSAAARSSAIFSSYQREVSRTLKPVFREEMQRRLFRFPIVESSSLETSQAMESQRAQVKAQQHSRDTNARTVRRAAGRLHMVPTPEAMNNPDSARALNDLAEFMEDEDSADGGEKQ